MKKYLSLLWVVVTAVTVGLPPAEPTILVRVVSYLLGIAAGLHLAVLLMIWIAKHDDHKSQVDS